MFRPKSDTCGALFCSIARSTVKNDLPNEPPNHFGISDFPFLARMPVTKASERYRMALEYNEANFWLSLVLIMFFDERTAM